jgi:hypothetical protein
MGMAVGAFELALAAYVGLFDVIAIFLLSVTWFNQDDFVIRARLHRVLLLSGVAMSLVLNIICLEPLLVSFGLRYPCLLKVRSPLPHQIISGSL